MIDAPPIDDHGLFTFQKILYRRKYFDYDARGQIILTCRCILESEGNEGAFSEPFVSAVHGVCSKKELADRGLELIQAFDQIPLQKIVETMRGLDLFKESSIRQYLPISVENKVRRILLPPQPEPVRSPSTKERRAADKQATAAANRRIVEQKIEFGRKLVALRDATPNNRRFGAAVRKFGHDDPLHVAEVMRVARFYGARPEIFRNVGWRTLTQLASSATSESQRQKFEARIARRRTRHRSRNNPRTRRNWSSQGADGFGLMCIHYDQLDGAPRRRMARPVRACTQGFDTTPDIFRSCVPEQEPLPCCGQTVGRD
jgi:hypothetical protein